MTLDETMRLARQAVDAPHPDGYVSSNTYVPRDVLRALIDEITCLQREAARPTAAPTLRDEFAMHALGGLFGSGTCHETCQAADLIANAAYTVADAMLAARGAK
jgi:hypothetical protein